MSTASLSSVRRRPASNAAATVADDDDDDDDSGGGGEVNETRSVSTRCCQSVKCSAMQVHHSVNYFVLRTREN